MRFIKVVTSKITKVGEFITEVLELITKVMTCYQVIAITKVAVTLEVPLGRLAYTSNESQSVIYIDGLSKVQSVPGYLCPDAHKVNFNQY